MSNFETLSDEELLKLPEPEVQSEEVVSEEVSDELPDPTEDGVETTETTTTTEEGEPSTESEQVLTTEGVEASDTADVSIDYKAEYERLMSPIRANGRDIQLQNTEEAIKLIQMGAGFTRKMQELAPYRKHLMMLEDNGLLDAQKLSYLIDLDKKNPEAIKKLLTDSGIDPLDIDTTAPQEYRASNYQVSDSEVNFRTTLEDLGSTAEGQSTIQAVHYGWDQASKEILGSSPDILDTIHQHRLLGVYDAVSNEVVRQRTLGNISSSEPFILAYKAVGDQLAKSGALNRFYPSTNTSHPLAVRSAAPKATPNNNRAMAAGISGNQKVAGKSVLNLASASDEEFLKAMEGRI